METFSTVIKSISGGGGPDIIVKVGKGICGGGSGWNNMMWVILDQGPMIDDIGRHDELKGAEKY